MRGQRAQLALQVNALQADDASLDQATRDIEENLRGQQALATDAERAAREAAQASVEAQAAADAKAAEVDALQARMTQFAVDAYVNPPGNDELDRLKADNASDAAQKEALLDVSATRASDVLDQLRAARSDYQRERERADQAKADAEARAARGTTANDRTAAGPRGAAAVREPARGEAEREAGRVRRAGQRGRTSVSDDRRGTGRARPPTTRPRTAAAHRPTRMHRQDRLRRALRPYHWRQCGA